MRSFRFNSHSEQMHKHLRGIPDGREVIILNPRVARISHGEAVYHFCVAKISLAERRIKLVIRRCDFYLVSPRKKFL